MAHLSKIFSKQKVDIPNKSGYDISHENMLTMTTGTLVPVLCEEVLPNETYSLGYMSQVQLPPMATNFYGRVDLRLEAFFVPNRILWGGWENFMTMPVNNPFAPQTVRPTVLPSLGIGDIFSGSPKKVLSFEELFGAGSLFDYLGFKVEYSDEKPVFTVDNLLPLLAYHKIYDDWYRNPNITKPLFVRPDLESIGTGSVHKTSMSFLPWSMVDDKLHDLFRVYPIDESYNSFAVGDSLFFAGNVASSAVTGDYPHLFTLHQRQWAKDYFTTASLYPQSSGDVTGSTVQIGDVGEAAQGFTIAQLRTANVLQRWLERNNIAGQRYSDQIKATWGIMPSDALLDRPLFLGSHKFGVYNNSVYQNSQQAANDGQRNPFAGSLGSKGGNMNGMGDGSLIGEFTATEHGHIIVLASLVPHAYYSSGVRRMFSRSKIGDFANPLLQGLGEQPLYKFELGGLSTYQTKSLFGYQQQYSEYKYHDDEVHGLLRDGKSLESFALQRHFALNDEVDINLSTEFLEIPKNFLDSVTAADYEQGALTWADFYFNFKKVSPLSEYVIPTLGDMKNTHKEEIDYRGRYL